MTSIFIDTSAFIACFRREDLDHRRAARILRMFDRTTEPVVTDYVIDETYTGLLNRESYAVAMEFDHQLSRGRWTIERITPERFAKAQDVFRRFNRDKEWSFTDCTSYVVMKELRIKTAFSFDKHFQEMGVAVL